MKLLASLQTIGRCLVLDDVCSLGNSIAWFVEPALTILSTVTSRPSLNRIVCDSGFKTTGKGFGEPELINFGEIKSFEFSAEHGMITLVDENSSVSVGDRIEFVPAYSDATVFLHEYIYGIRNNVIETVWPVIGRGKLH